ncbi:hypothetical protein JL722_11795 [Aureococcus anophagefferens]|nr:hypothetical protein JL722_11795 [Aureococcus anophagefferens]
MAAATAGAARRRPWSPEFQDLMLYAFFLAALCTSNVANSSSAPYYMRRNLEDLFLANEFEPNVAFGGVASRSQILAWAARAAVAYAQPDSAWSAAASRAAASSPTESRSASAPPPPGRPHADMFGVVRACVEVLPGGALLPTYQVIASPVLGLYRSLFGDALPGARAAYLELAFFALCAAYAAREARVWLRSPRYFDSFWNWLEAINLSTYVLVAALRVALVFWVRASGPLDDPAGAFPAELVKMAQIGTMIDSLNAINMVFSFFKVFKYFRHFDALAQFTDTCAPSVADCAVLLLILGVELFGFAVAFFVGYGGSMEEYKDLGSSFTTLFDARRARAERRQRLRPGSARSPERTRRRERATRPDVGRTDVDATELERRGGPRGGSGPASRRRLLGASDISGLVDHDYVLVTLLFFPFVMMNTFVVLSMFLTVIGISFEDVAALSRSVARRGARGRRTSAFLETSPTSTASPRALGACPGRAIRARALAGAMADFGSDDAGRSTCGGRRHGAMALGAPGGDDAAPAFGAYNQDDLGLGDDDDDDDDDGGGVGPRQRRRARRRRWRGVATRATRAALLPQCGNMWQPREARATAALMLTCRNCGDPGRSRAFRPTSARAYSKVSTRPRARSAEHSTRDTRSSDTSDHVSCDACGHHTAVLFQAESGVTAVSLSLIFVAARAAGGGRAPLKAGAGTTPGRRVR